MYGSEHSDLVVKYYDQSFGISGESEINWYLKRARKIGGPVLDLACGTGRIAILLAREGFEVHAIDQSEGMLDVFRRKLEQEPDEIKRRIDITQAPMSNFRLDRKFKTVICVDAFFHNLTVKDQMDCLRCVREHLAPEGRFLFNLPNPTCDFILASQESQGKKFSERGRYELEDGSRLAVEQAAAGDLAAQTTTTTLRITRYDGEGNEIEKGESSWTARYLFRYEAEHLLYRCGFEIEEMVGDYHDGPVTEKGQLVFQVKIT
jgi:2-polyprenyl-3-methyl-5-hydroxy-6-metoxy-1,4-benzoquinol methylase